MKSSKLDIISDSLLFFWGLYIVFVSYPVQMYQTNVKDLSFQHADLFAMVSIFSVLILSILFALLRARFKHVRLIAFVVFTASVYLLVRDFALPFPEFELSGDLPKINEYGIKAAIDVSLLLFLIICLWFLYRIQRMNYIMAIGCLGFLAADALTLSSFESQEAKTTNIRKHAGKLAPNPQAMPNIYHIVFDGFGGRSLLDVAKGMKAEKAFEGFTYFKNVWANYYPTYPSMASIMQSNFFGIDTPKGMTYTNWTIHNRTLGQGLLRNFYDYGYTLSQYLYRPANTYNVPSAYKFSEKDLNSPDRALLLTAVTAARLAPIFLREETFNNVLKFSNHAIHRNSMLKNRVVFPLEFYLWDSIKIFSKMRQQEVKRPAHGQYVYVHLFLPHGPFSVDNECRPKLSYNWRTAAKCSVKLMMNLIGTLKSLGRFKYSIILLQSDHGNNYFPFSDDDKKLMIREKRLLKKFHYNSDVAEKNQMTRSEWAMRRMLMMARPLLLIKPQHHAVSPLVVDNNLSELVDIGPTLYDLARINVKTSRSLSLFLKAHKGKSEIHIFPETNSWRSNYQNGDPVKIKAFKKRVLPHLILNEKTGWRHAGDIPIIK